MGLWSRKKFKNKTKPSNKQNQGHSALYFKKNQFLSNGYSWMFAAWAITMVLK